MAFLDGLSYLFLKPAIGLSHFKVVQVRADLNVPLDKDLNITDDTRIRAAIPTLKYLTDNGAKVLLTSHLVSCCPYCDLQVFSRMCTTMAQSPFVRDDSKAWRGESWTCRDGQRMDLRTSSG